MPTEIEIKKQLAECYEQKHPVLLCGDSSFDYVDLVIQIHKASGGIESSWEYFGSDKSLNTNEAMSEEMKKAIEEHDFVRMDEILRNCKSTPATMASFDWSIYDCNNLFNNLVTRERCRDRDHMLLRLDIEYLGTKGNMFLDFEPSDNGQYWQWSLLERKGMLFIINLFCQTEEDKRICERLAPKIKVRKDNDYKTGDWLVMHTLDPSDFPGYFRNQFVEIPIGGEKKSGSSIVGYEGNSKSKKESTLISMPPNTKWSDIEMGIDYYNKKICIKVREKTTRFGFFEFGLKDSRSKKDRMTDLLKRLLGYAGAENNMVYTGKMQKKEFEKLDTDTKRLNKLIRSRIKGIDSPPITYTKSEGFKSNFGKLYLISTDYDRSREIITSELQDMPDTNMKDNENLD